MEFLWQFYFDGLWTFILFLFFSSSDFSFVLLSFWYFFRVCLLMLDLILSFSYFLYTFHIFLIFQTKVVKVNKLWLIFFCHFSVPIKNVLKHSKQNVQCIHFVCIPYSKVFHAHLFSVLHSSPYLCVSLLFQSSYYTSSFLIQSN